MNAIKEVATMIIMIDIETLAKRPDGVVWQIGLMAVDASEPDRSLVTLKEHLPIQPQLNLGRVIDADTLLWWLRQDKRALDSMQNCAGDEVQELFALLRALNRKVQEAIDMADDYEIWARGPQFDIVMLESLMANANMKPAWSYSKVRDLRTLMAMAGIQTDQVEKPRGYVAHDAYQDCRYQVACYESAIKYLFSPKAPPQPTLTLRETDESVAYPARAFGVADPTLPIA